MGSGSLLKWASACPAAPCLPQWSRWSSLLLCCATTATLPHWARGSGRCRQACLGVTGSPSAYRMNSSECKTSKNARQLYRECHATTILTGYFRNPCGFKRMSVPVQTCSLPPQAVVRWLGMAKSMEPRQWLGPLRPSSKHSPLTICTGNISEIIQASWSLRELLLTSRLLFCAWSRAATAT